MKENIGFGICGSFCTFEKIFEVLKKLVEQEYNIFPVMSFSASKTDTRFGEAKNNIRKIEDICSKKAILDIKDAEPIGPQKLFDILVVAPCTGNTLGKLAAGIADTPVTMAVKAHLRNQRPVLIGVSTNDGLSTSAKNIGELLNRKNIFFIPMRQDDSVNKPLSIVADFNKTEEAIKKALEFKQIQPIYN
ncbi:MAG: dipicolinate synthase subunit B [Oscillospiraceae bacterium]|nr:dipicolinate synthase subunit B [Oscillospiraceae bacterium]